MKKFISMVLALVIVASLAVSASARLLGDINSDGKVNTTDALAILQYSVGFDTLPKKEYGDVNGDGKINTTDALITLQICVGLYQGELEVDDGFTTDYKSKVVDPILKTQKFTLGTTVSYDGTSTPVTIMVRGSDLAVDMTYSGLKCRLLLLNGKTYMVIPLILTYVEIDEEMPEFDIGVRSDLTYKGSVNEKIGSTTYIKERYVTPAGVEYNYYFLNGTWKYLQIIDDDGETMQKIDSFKSGVTDSNFSLKGYTKRDIDV